MVALIILVKNKEEMTQPLNEAYQNEILEAYQKISDTFDDFTQLMRKRVPYEQWPEHCKIAGVSEHLLGPASPDFGCSPKGTKITGFDKRPEMIPIPDFPEQLSNHSDECVKKFAECVKEGWRNVQGDCRHDESFRAMLRVMIHWMAYLEKKGEAKEANDNIWDILKARGLDPTKAFPMAMISRLEDIGQAKQKLKDILDSEIFENTSKHSPYWHSDHCLEEDKLDDLRGKISCLSDNLWDLWAILRKEEEF